MIYQVNRKSRPVEVVAYREEWVREFADLAAELRAIFRTDAWRIDHIGSTSVPGLAAKDIVDVQVTVADLDDDAPWIERMSAAGYQFRGGLQTDHQPPWFRGDVREWEKRYAREPIDRKRTHIHIRAAGRENQKFALLFRDFLRARPAFALSYAQVKQRLSELFPDSIDNYLYIKDPVVDVIVAAAADWADTTGWTQGKSDA